MGWDVKERPCCSGLADCKGESKVIFYVALQVRKYSFERKIAIVSNLSTLLNVSQVELDAKDGFF
jgi:hypothetical protein